MAGAVKGDSQDGLKTQPGEQRQRPSQHGTQVTSLNVETGVSKTPGDPGTHHNQQWGDFRHLREAVTQSGGELVRDAATDRFAWALNDLGVPQFDALPPLRQALPGPDVFFQQTVHLTPRGHEIVAGALERFLRESGLLDERPVSPARQ